MNKGFEMQLAVSTGSLETYIQSVGNIPMLTVEEERDLATRLQKYDDLDAAQRLVLAHLRFVVHVARGYNGYGLPIADLIQEGNVGLMKAVKRFDPTVGVRLVSFAVHWIRAEMHEYILRNWRIVKVATTKAQRKLFFNLRSAKKRLGWFTREEVNAVAKDLGVKPETVLEMESRLSGHDASFDGYADDSDEDNFHATPAAYLQDTSMEPAGLLEADDLKEHNNAQLHDAIQSLDARSQDILARRWLTEDKVTLQELANEYDVSAERIRQLEKNAMNKVKKVLVA